VNIEILDEQLQFAVARPICLQSSDCRQIGQTAHNGLNKYIKNYSLFNRSSRAVSSKNGSAVRFL
jgi:hypothetical protein